MFASNILLLAAHPDDEIVGCCAAIARARAQGASVSVLFLTTGIPAPERFWPWQRSSYSERVRRRRAEAEMACSTLGLQILGFSGLPSRELVRHLPSAASAIRQHVTRLRPAIVWAPAYEGGHPDHDLANFAASTLRTQTQVWEYSEYNFFARVPRSNCFFAPAGNEVELRLSPQERAAKTSALALYASERRNLSYIRPFQEAFRPLADYDYSRPPHPGTLFYRRYWWAGFHPAVNHVRPEQVCRAIADCRARL